jgi:tRNA(Ile)-lysidine synthetase-like protein
MNTIYSLQNFYTVLYENVNNEKKPVTRLQKQQNLNAYEINNIVSFWGSYKNHWFSHQTLDIYRFDVIQSPITRTFQQMLSFIIQYDQLYRHPSKQHVVKSPFHAYRFATQCALYILNNLFNEFCNAESWKQVFILLALRHNNSLCLKYLALKKINYLIQQRIDNDIQIDNLHIRFLNATIMDIDSFKKKSGFTDYKPESFNKYEISQTILNTSSTLLQNHKCIHLLYHNILDKECMTNANTKSSDYNISLVTKHNTQEYMDLIMKLISGHIDKGIKQIALSISGGVDSMVCSFILSHIAKKYGINVICLHICYNNRDCVDDELMFLSSWCSILNMPLYVRKIDEIQRLRNTKFRACYEEVTRKIRFSFYDYFKCPVILGHNLDDCYENAFSNLSKQIHFDNLYGMKKETIESNITILRPFLEIPKNDLIKYANDAVIPHLFDSTPPWSRRGKTRNTLMPAIDNFDPNILIGLRSYIDYTNHLSDAWQENFDKWIKQYTCVSFGDIEIKKDSFFNHNYERLNFWIQLWFTLEFPTRPSNKSLTNFIRIIRNNQHISCNLNKSFRVKNYVDRIIIMKDT